MSSETASIFSALTDAEFHNLLLKTVIKLSAKEMVKQPKETMEFWEILASREDAPSLFADFFQSRETLADELITTINEGGLSDLQKYKSIDGITLLFVIDRVDKIKDVRRKQLNDVLKSMYQEYAKKPRPNGQKNEEREMVQEFWDKWQKGECKYDNKTAFDSAMMDKTGISKTTIQKWRKALENGGRLVDTPT